MQAHTNEPHSVPISSHHSQLADPDVTLFSGNGRQRFPFLCSML